MNPFTQHFHPQPVSASFYDSLLSLEKFIDKKHAFDDFAHLVFKAPLFEDLMAVVSVYTSAFGPMSDREVAMVQKRMYQLNRQTVRAMHEIINQKQLIAGINSKETNLHSSATKTPPANVSGLFGSSSLTPLPMGMHSSLSPMAHRHTTSQPFGGFPGHNELPTTILNTPVQTPTGPDRYFSSKPTSSAGKSMDCHYNDRNSMTVQELLRLQQNWATSLLNNAGCKQMNEPSSLHTPTAHGSMAMDNSSASASFFMSPPSQTPMFPAAMMPERSMMFAGVGGNIVDDCGKLRSNPHTRVSTRRRLRSG